MFSLQLLFFPNNATFNDAQFTLAEILKKRKIKHQRSHQAKELVKDDEHRKSVLFIVVVVLLSQCLFSPRETYIYKRHLLLNGIRVDEM